MPGLFTLPGRVVGWRGLFVFVGWGGWAAPRVCSFSLGGVRRALGGCWFGGVGPGGWVRAGCWLGGVGGWFVGRRGWFVGRRGWSAGWGWGGRRVGSAGLGANERGPTAGETRPDLGTPNLRRVSGVGNRPMRWGLHG